MSVSYLICLPLVLIMSSKMWTICVLRGCWMFFCHVTEVLGECNRGSASPAWAPNVLRDTVLLHLCAPVCSCAHTEEERDKNRDKKFKLVVTIVNWWLWKFCGICDWGRPSRNSQKLRFINHNSFLRVPTSEPEFVLLPTAGCSRSVKYWAHDCDSSVCSCCQKSKSSTGGWYFV